MIRRLIEITRREGIAGLHRRVLMRLRWPGAVPSLYGPRFTANHGDTTFRMYVWGAYGNFYWRKLRDTEFPFVFLDIGANQGLYAIGAARNGKSVSVLAFEPVPTTYTLLERNVRLNRVSEKCRLVNAAISDRTGETRIHIPQGHSGGATIASGRVSDGLGGYKEVPIRLIDAAELERLVPNGTSPILVKIDVEGFEPVVIGELLKSSFAPRMVEIFLEIDENLVNAAEIRQRLCEAGFSEFHVVGSGTHYDLLAKRPGTPGLAA